jgi:chaperone required for assembly of F1-ATPase
MIPSDTPLRPPVKRFYTSAAAGADNSILLDGRPVRTPGKSRLHLPTPGLAAAVAVEWEAQGLTLDPLSMPLTRLANTVLDGVAQRAPAVRADLVGYAASDLVCYRATHPDALVGLQVRHWDPIVAWATRRFGVAPRVTAGLMPVAQPDSLQRAIGAGLSSLDPWRLASLHVMTTLTGSLLIALGRLERAWSLDAAWAAAHVDEDYQITQWGEDFEAAERRAARRADFDAADRMISLLA